MGQSFQHKQKRRALEYKGGKCQRCGYDKCSRALHFHHTDPGTKSFSISGTDLGREWSVLKAELDKCILVCANCHAEIHEELERQKPPKSRPLPLGYKGELNGRAKLTWVNVDQIRLIGRSQPAREVAPVFGVSKRTVHRIIAGELWPESSRTAGGNMANTEHAG